MCSGCSKRIICLINCDRSWDVVYRWILELKIKQLKERVFILYLFSVILFIITLLLNFLFINIQKCLFPFHIDTLCVFCVEIYLRNDEGLNSALCYLIGFWLLTNLEYLVSFIFVQKWKKREGRQKYFHYFWLQKNNFFFSLNVFFTFCFFNPFFFLFYYSKVKEQNCYLIFVNVMRWTWSGRHVDNKVKKKLIHVWCRVNSSYMLW